MDDIKASVPKIILKRFTSVLFGADPSPFLLNGTVHVHMNRYIDVNKPLVDKFLQDLYMDDSISGKQNIDDAFEFYLFAKTSMLEASFELRKWNSNSKELLDAISSYEKEFFDNDQGEIKTTCKVLGIQWHTDTDELEFDIGIIATPALRDAKISKRVVLRTVSSIYSAYYHRPL